MSNLVSFTPLLRQTVGFDRFNDMFESLLANGEERTQSYPPYNIEKTDENAYEITIAVAGFSQDDIDITVEGDSLTVSGHIPKMADAEAKTYLHRGIATRDFSHTFRLADHIKVEGADMDNGLLTIALIREVPEEKKPRSIAIKSGNGNKLLGGKSKKK